MRYPKRIGMFRTETTHAYAESMFYDIPSAGLELAQWRAVDSGQLTGSLPWMIHQVIRGSIMTHHS
jgi:hypothetical protein